MEKIIDAAEVDIVVIGTPIDLRRVITISKPAVRVRYDLEVLPDSPSLTDVLAPVLEELSDRDGTGRSRWSVSSSRSEATPCSDAAPRTRSRRCTERRGWPRSGSPISPPPGWEVVVTHGNGPQVGRILLQQEAAKDVVHPMPLDVCGAESQGQIGYLLQVTIGDVFFERGMERPVATILTLTRVRAAGSRVPQADEVRRAVLRRGEATAPGRGARLRDEAGSARRVASRGAVAEAVLDRRDAGDRAARWPTGTIVIASGGGGIPVIEKGPRLIGKEGVVDKDLAAAHPGPRGRGVGPADPHGRVARATRIRLALSGGHRAHDRRPKRRR